MIGKISNLILMTGIFSCAAISQPATMARANGGASTGGGDQNNKVPAYVYKCKLAYSEPSMTESHIETLIFNNQNNGKIVEVAALKLSVGARWNDFDLDPVEPVETHEFSTSVKIWIGTNKTFISVPFAQQTVSIATSGELADGSGRASVQVRCVRDNAAAAAK